MELSNIQNTILEATEPIIFVSSSAGSGKTKVLTEKVRQSIQKGKSIVAFTFTNMASGEMKKRLQVDNNDNSSDLLSPETGDAGIFAMVSLIVVAGSVIYAINRKKSK